MRSLTVLVLVGLLTAGLVAGEKKYGKALTLKSKVKVSEVLANPEKYKGQRIQIEGPVVDVCKTRGCWIKIGSDKEFEALRFKVEDGVIVFPLEAKGKNAVAEGVLSVKTVSVEEQVKAGKHAAEEAGTTFDASTVKGPKTIVQLQGEGAVIK